MRGEWGRTLVRNLTLPLYVAERLGKALGRSYVQAWSQWQIVPMSAYGLETPRPVVEVRVHPSGTKRLLKCR